MKYGLLKYQIENEIIINDINNYFNNYLKEYIKKNKNITPIDETHAEMIEIMMDIYDCYYENGMHMFFNYERLKEIFISLLQIGMENNEFDIKSLEAIIVVSILCEKEETIYDELNDFYKKNVKNHSILLEYTKIGLYGIYLKVGDFFLFNKRDFNKAYKWYRLYSYDNLGANKEINASIFMRLTKRTSYSDEIMKRYLDSNIYQLYINCISCEYDSYSIKDIVSKCDEYVAYIKNIIESISINDYRYVFVTNYYVKDMCLIPVLFDYSNSSKTIINEELIYRMLKETNNIQLKKLNKVIKERNISDLLKYIKIIEYTYFIKNKLEVKNEIRIAYYTKFSSLFHMLPNRCKNEDDIRKLNLMNIAYMNDPNEGKALNGFFFKNIDEKYNNRKVLNPSYVFLKCFTSKIDDIPMWEMYGDHAKGCCVILKVNKKKRIAAGNYNMNLYKVCYINNKDKDSPVESKNNENIEIDDINLLNEWLRDLKCIIETISLEDIASSILEDIKYLFKDIDYSHEGETRIIKYFDNYSEDFRLTEEETPKLYVLSDNTVSIDEIIIGPRCEKPNEKAPFIKEEFSKITGIKPKITISGVNYK